ncbi:MAG: AbrB/MazE/SpoVT family DNA-binding domain-containing protein [Nitrososphaerota archaeon]
MESEGEVVKVTRNFQVTIPSRIRSRTDIREGSFVRVIYDEVEGVIKIIPLKRKRLTVTLGRQITVEEIEKAVEEMLDEATS